VVATVPGDGTVDARRSDGGVSGESWPRRGPVPPGAALDTVLLLRFRMFDFWGCVLVGSGDEETGYGSEKKSKLRGQISEEPRKSLDRWPGTIMRITRNHSIK
jgi:hypothetical protein